MAPNILTLQDLCERASVSSRTIRYYIQQGLLPPPDGAGRGAAYSQAHLDQLQLILKLKKQHQPLTQIRRRLENLTPEDVSRLLKGPSPIQANSAADYVRAVLSGQQARVEPPPSKPRPPANTSTRTRTRSAWERHTISPEVEIHIQRPLSREANQHVRALLRIAQDLFDQDKS
jgi:DNA-binding transcriptional MerR regulator